MVFSCLAQEQKYEKRRQPGPGQNPDFENVLFIDAEMLVAWMECVVDNTYFSVGFRVPSADMRSTNGYELCA